MASRKPSEASASRLLGLLPAKNCRRLQRYQGRVPPTYRQSLYRARRLLGLVYFIKTGVGSLVNAMANGDAVEVGRIGNEGVVGRPLLLSDSRAPTSVYVQVPGAGLGMTAAQFHRELARGASMQKQAAQSAACNHFHSLQQRCCRWMPMRHDRLKSYEFLLTRKFFAVMLGVQCTGISVAAAVLRRAAPLRKVRSGHA